MANVFKVAEFFITWANDSSGHMTNLWLNKLLYFAQGQYLARESSPLFAEQIQAWKHGPVVPEVYHKYKVCGDAPIPTPEPQDMSDSDLTATEKELLFDVIRKYGIYNAWALRDMSHETAPWKNSFNGDFFQEITQKDMQDFFSLDGNKIKSVEIDFSKVEFDGYRDKEGYLVLPAEDDDGDWEV